MPELIAVPSVKFEILLPVTYIDPADPTETPRFVQLTEIFDYLDEMTVRYGGYTTSNPFAPPPFSGGYQGGPQERNFMVMVIVPDHLLNQADQNIRQMVKFFQEKYHQKELLCYHYHVNRYVPQGERN